MSEETYISARWYGRLSGSPAELLVIEGMAETAKAGHLLGIHVSPGNECIIAFHEDEAVAVLVIDEYDDLGELWIHFGYCKPQYRRGGYYRKCIEILKEKARERGYSRIHTAAAPDNGSAITSIRARGGTLQYMGFTFPVDD